MNIKTERLNQMAHEARTRYSAACVAGAVARGEMRWSYSERLERLMTRLRGHKRHGRERAAMACRRMVERMLDEMEAYE